MLRLLNVGYNLAHHHKLATNATLVLGVGGSVSGYVLILWYFEQGIAMLG